MLNLLYDYIIALHNTIKYCLRVHAFQFFRRPTCQLCIVLNWFNNPVTE